MQVSHSDLSLLVTHTSGLLPEELLDDLNIIKSCESASKYLVGKVLKLVVNLADAVKAEQKKKKICKDEEPETMEEVGLIQGKSENQHLTEEVPQIPKENDKIWRCQKKKLMNSVDSRQVFCQRGRAVDLDREHSMPYRKSSASNDKNSSLPSVQNHLKNHQAKQRQSERRKLYTYILNLIRVLHRQRNHKWLQKELMETIPKNYFNPQRLSKMYRNEQFRNGLLGISIAEDLRKIEDSIDIDKLISDKNLVLLRKSDILGIIRSLREATEVQNKHQIKKGSNRNSK